MLMCWFAPPRVLGRVRRQTLLAFLDALGKWSLIDMFVLVMMMVAFRFQLAVPEVRQCDRFAMFVFVTIGNAIR